MVKIDINKNLHGSKGDMELKVDIEIEKGDFIAIAGESGSGKTTFLRILAGLEKANGKIEVDNEIWKKGKIELPPQKRKIGFVFQNYALFENMTIEKNLLFVNRDRNLANHLLEITELKTLKERYPYSLSGGQKQRVALCRALMNRPKLLLLDEPLSALDPKMRKKLQREIYRLHKEFKTTTIIVSHEPSEIYRLANRVLLFSNGKVIKDRTPKELFIKNSNSQKFTFEGEIIDIIKKDKNYFAIILINQELIEIEIDFKKAEILEIGQKVTIGSKSPFEPIINISL